MRSALFDISMRRNCFRRLYIFVSQVVSAPQRASQGGGETTVCPLRLGGAGGGVTVGLLSHLQSAERNTSDTLDKTRTQRCVKPPTPHAERLAASMSLGRKAAVTNTQRRADAQMRTGA